MNIYEELEVIYSLYPTPENLTRDGIVIPKASKDQFKFSKYIKECIQQSIYCGQHHRMKRCYLIQEINTMMSIIQCNPGLVAPKFPVLMALCSMARTEILFYFIHLSNWDGMRRDLQKSIPRAELSSFKSDVSILMQKSMEILSFICKYYKLVQEYYQKFLCRTDALSIASQATEIDSHLSPLGEQYTTLLYSLATDLQSLSGVHIDSSCTINSSFELSDEEISKCTVKNRLMGYRLNCHRLEVVLSTDMVLNADPSVVRALVNRMNDTHLRSMYVDNIDGLIKSYCSLHDVWWYNLWLMEDFCQLIDISNARAVSPTVLYDEVHLSGYLAVCNAAEHNTHPDLPIEEEILKTQVHRFTDKMIDLYTSRVISYMDFLDSELYNLDKLVAPQEAVSRLKRVIAMKNKNIHEHDPLPGVESSCSTPHRTNMTYNASLYYQHIVNILTSLHLSLYCSKIWGKKYLLLDYVIEDTEQYLADRLGKLFNTELSIVDVHDMADRPLHVVSRFVHSCHIIYHVLGHVTTTSGKGLDISGLIRKVLFKASCDTSISPPGTIVSNPSNECNSFIGKVVGWFGSLIGILTAPGSNNGDSIVYVPSKEIFVHFRLQNNQYIGFDHDIEGYLNASDMSALCMLIGVQGVRALEHMFLNFIADKVWCVCFSISNLAVCSTYDGPIYSF